MNQKNLSDIILKVFSVNGLLVELGNSITSHVGLSSASWKVLGAVSESTSTVPQIARRMGMSRQNVLRITTNLIKEGYIRKEENIDHKRSPKLVANEKGMESLKSINAKYLTWLRSVSEGFNEDDLIITLKELSKMEEVLEKN